MTSETFVKANEIQEEINQLDKERADLICIMPPSKETQKAWKRYPRDYTHEDYRKYGQPVPFRKFFNIFRNDKGNYEIKDCNIELTLDDINMLIKARHEKIMELKTELEEL